MISKRTKAIFQTGSLYHIYNRGVEKRKIFMDDSFYRKFLNNLWDFNDARPSPDNRIHRDRNSVDRQKLVEIYGYVLMPNHYHLVIRQLVDGGIERYMRKVGIGYAMYFNTRENRVGPLFQGRFRVRTIEDDTQLLQLFRYIYLNPLKVYQPNYQEIDLSNVKEARDYIYNYPWSSCRNFIDQRHDPLIDDFTEFVTLDPKGRRDFVLSGVSPGPQSS